MAKRKKPKKEKNEGIFFVEVANKDQIRASNLEAVRIVLRLMHGYEGYKSVKHEKERSMAKLKLQLKEIGGLVGQLKSALPAVNIKFKKEKPKQELAPKPEKALKKASGQKGAKAKKSAKARPQMQKEYTPREAVRPVAEPKREMSELERLESELNAIESKLQGLG